MKKKEPMLLNDETIHKLEASLLSLVKQKIEATIENLKQEAQGRMHFIEPEAEMRVRGLQESIAIIDSVAKSSYVQFAKSLESFMAEYKRSIK